MSGTLSPTWTMRRSFLMSLCAKSKPWTIRGNGRGDEEPGPGHPCGHRCRAPGRRASGPRLGRAVNDRGLALGDWESIFARMANEVRALVARRSSGRPIRVELSAGELLDK